VQENIFPIKDTILQQSDKELLKKHKGIVLWMFGLSGSGKSTIAKALENELFTKGIHTKLLDGDNLRSGINNNLSFSIEDRTENIRRAAEISKLFMENGDVVICSLVSPTKKIRAQAKSIIGAEGFKEVYVNASFDVCAKRDVKGLYKKALAGEIKNFTGLDSPFEGADHPFVEIKTDEKSLETCKNELLKLVLKEIQL
jgi:adenylylsulfate kinase|tara:strand:+ start:166 stop:762 length:597 start_codon:yes stop_codon:yes gene_type:complete